LLNKTLLFVTALFKSLNTPIFHLMQTNLIIFKYLQTNYMVICFYGNFSKSSAKDKKDESAGDKM